MILATWIIQLGIIRIWLYIRTSKTLLGVELALLKLRTMSFLFYWFNQEISHPFPPIPVICILNWWEAALPDDVLPNPQPLQWEPQPSHAD